MDQDMPPVLRRLWAPAEQADREPRLGLTLPRIVTAAIELADANGLDAVSMSRLAKHLGYTTMSLYRYVTNKDELLLLMHDTAWQVPSSLDSPTGGWRDNLVRWCQEQRAVMRRHPWLESIRVTERVGTPSQLTWIDRGLRALAGTPLEEYEKTRILLLLSGHVFWDARVLNDFRDTMRASGQNEREMVGGFGALMAGATDPDRFPALMTAVTAGAFDMTGWLRADFEAEYTFALDLILDGVAQAIARRPGSGS